LEKRTPLLIANILRFLSLSTFGTLLQFYMKDIGTSLFLIGLFSSIQGIITTFFSPIWGSVSDILPKKKIALALSVGLGGFAAIFYYFTNSTLEIYLVGIFFAFFICGFEPVAMALSANTSLIRKTSTSRELSIFNMSNSIGVLIGTALLSVLLAITSPQKLFLIMGAILISAVIPIFMIKEKKELSQYRRKPKSFLETLLPILKDPEPLKQNGMWALYISTILRQSSTAVIISLGAVFVRDIVGLNESLTVITSGVNPLMQIPAIYLFGRLAEKIHPKYITIIGMSLSVLNLILLGSAQNYVLVVLAYLTLGISYAAFITGSTSYVSMYSPINRRGEMLGFLSSARALGGILGPLLAGSVSMLSFRAAFFVTAAVISVSIPIMLKFTVSKSPEDLLTED